MAPPDSEGGPSTKTILFTLFAGSIGLLVSNLSTRAALLPFTPPANIDTSCQKYHPDLFNKCEDVRVFSAGVDEYALTGCDPHRRSWPPIGYKFDSPNEGGTMYLWKIGAPEETPRKITGLPEKLVSLGSTVVRLSDMKMRVFTTNRHPLATGIEVYDLDVSSATATHLGSVQHKLIYNPNSISALSANEVVFTNEHKHTQSMVPEIVLGLPIADIGHIVITPGAGKLQAVVSSIKKISAPNGIAVDLKLNKLWIASMTYGVYSFDYKKKGASIKLSGQKVYRTPFLPDNLSLDGSAVVVAGHPSTQAVTALMGSSDAPQSPSWALRMVQHGEDTTKAMSDLANKRLSRAKDMVWTTLFQDNGSFYGGSVTAAVFSGGKKVIVSGFLDDGLVVCDLT